MAFGAQFPACRCRRPCNCSPHPPCRRAAHRCPRCLCQRAPLRRDVASQHRHGCRPRGRPLLARDAHVPAMRALAAAVLVAVLSTLLGGLVLVGGSPWWLGRSRRTPSCVVFSCAGSMLRGRGWTRDVDVAGAPTCSACVFRGGGACLSAAVEYGRRDSWATRLFVAAPCTCVVGMCAAKESAPLGNKHEWRRLSK